MPKPALGFDTSAHNRLADASDKEALITAVNRGFRACVAGLNVEEFAATPDAVRRNELFSNCARLLSAGFCLQPPHEIFTLMVRSFQAQQDFDWRLVDVSAPEFAREIAFREISNAELAKEQKEHARRTQKEFAALFDGVRPVFERLFLSGTEARPADFPDLVRRLQVDGGAFWSLAIGLYARAANHTPDEQTIRRFVAASPPAHALLLALFLAQYERSVRAPEGGPSLRAGRADLFMSAYLPYCDYFVTTDERQLRCLKGITTIAGLSTVVLSYEDFVNGLNV